MIIYLICVFITQSDINLLEQYLLFNYYIQICNDIGLHYISSIYDR